MTPPAWSGEEYVGPEEQLALTRLRALKAERELRERTRMEAARKAVGACVDCGDRGQPCLCERAAAERARHTADTLQAEREQQDRQAQIAERQRRKDRERALPPPRRWERVWEHVRVAGGGTPSPRYRGTDGEARDQEEGEEVAEAVRRGRVQYRQVQEYLRHGGEEALEELLALIREKA